CRGTKLPMLTMEEEVPPSMLNVPAFFIRLIDEPPVWLKGLGELMLTTPVGRLFSTPPLSVMEVWLCMLTVPELLSTRDRPRPPEKLAIERTPVGITLSAPPPV